MTRTPAKFTQADERGALFNAISGLGEGGENKPPLKRKADSARLSHQCSDPGTFHTFGFCPTKSTDELSTLRGLRSWDFKGFQTATVNLGAA